MTESKKKNKLLVGRNFRLFMMETLQNKGKKILQAIQAIKETIKICAAFS
jgi:hypothetical protein